MQEEPEGVEDLEDNMYAHQHRSPNVYIETRPTYLLMNSAQKELIEQELAVRCQEASLEIFGVVKKIRNSLQVASKKS